MILFQLSDAEHNYALKPMIDNSIKEESSVSV